MDVHHLQTRCQSIGFEAQEIRRAPRPWIFYPVGSRAVMVFSRSLLFISSCVRQDALERCGCGVG
jgi:hypothetical protein